jgi:hypothetical protein
MVCVAVRVRDWLAESVWLELEDWLGVADPDGVELKLGLWLADRLCVWLVDTLCEAVGVPLWDCDWLELEVSDADCDWLGDCVWLAVAETLDVCDCDVLWDGVPLLDCDWEGDDVWEAVTLWLELLVWEALADCVGVCIMLGVCVWEALCVWVLDNVWDGDCVWVFVAVWDGVGDCDCDAELAWLPVWDWLLVVSWLAVPVPLIVLDSVWLAVTLCEPLDVSVWSWLCDWVPDSDGDWDCDRVCEGVTEQIVFTAASSTPQRGEERGCHVTLPSVDTNWPVATPWNITARKWNYNRKGY